MGRPLKAKSKTCSACGKTKNIASFYKSKNPLHRADERAPLCKQCIRNAALNDYGQIDEDRLKKVLQQVDSPYYKDLMQAAVDRSVRKYGKKETGKHAERVIGYYFQLINSLPQYRGKSFLQSQCEGFMSPSTTPGGVYAEDDYDDFTDCVPNLEAFSSQSKRSLITNVNEKPTMPTSSILSNIPISNDSTDILDSVNVNVPEEVIQRFGRGYLPEEYQMMEEKYQKIKNNWAIKSVMHEEFLLNYIRYKVKEEICTARGDISGAKQWADLATSAATQAKITPKQLSDTDLNNGVDSFSEIFRAVESAIDVIPILPQFKYRPNDACDFIIWCYVNYIRKLQGLPQCTYEELYHFYDERKADYIEQNGDPYGIFKDDPTEHLRDSVKKFITLPKDYDNSDNGDAS